MKQRVTYLALVLAAALAAGSCDKVPLLAPSGSTVTLSANATTAPTGGTVGLTAFVTESAGTAVQNGTTVRFTTTLGTVTPASVQTSNGLAIATFNAGDQSGIATISAVSGGATGTGTGTGTGGTTTPVNTVRITVGTAAVQAVTVRANPATVPASGGTVQIIANVTGGAASTDTSPVAGVPVSFTTTAGALNATSATTDASGSATVLLSTSRNATVTAVAGAKSATVSVTANAAASVTLAVSPSNPTVGQAVLLTITPGTDTAPDVTVDWGDGNASSVGVVRSAITVAHSYKNPGSFAIVVTGNQDGSAFQTSTAVAVTPAPSVTISASPNAGTTATVFVFTVTPAANNGVKDVTIDFGDGNAQDLGAITSAAGISHKYSSTGSYTVKATETDGAGNTTNAITVITVS
jgi:adhesin/invasin